MLFRPATIVKSMSSNSADESFVDASAMREVSSFVWRIAIQSSVSSRSLQAGQSLSLPLLQYVLELTRKTIKSDSS
jgi:hypothetical protein